METSLAAVGASVLRERVRLSISSAWPWGLGAGLWLSQLAIGRHLPLFADEAYYELWMARPALGYFDHGPGFAWLGHLLGGARTTAWWAALASSLLLMDSARRLGSCAWRWTPVMFLGTPLGFAAGLLGTPDSVLVLAMSGLIWCLAGQWYRWVWLWCALLVSSKHTAVFLLPVFLLFLTGRPRRQVVLGFVVGLVPQLYWSSLNDWLPWSYQSGRLLSGFQSVEFIIGQALLVGPLFLWWCLGYWRRGPGHLHFLWWLSGPIFGGWFLLSLGFRVEANWTALVWPAAVVAFMSDWGRGSVWIMRTNLALTLTGALVGLSLLAIASPGQGPPRDGVVLKECLASFGDVEPYTIRYQEQALLETVGITAEYRRPDGRRLSQFDLWGVRARPRCGGVLVGPWESQQAVCPGGIAGRVACDGLLTECQCRR